MKKQESLQLQILKEITLMALHITITLKIKWYTFNNGRFIPVE